MSIRKIARMGHPVLRVKTRDLLPEEFGSPEIERLIEDMVETMHEYEGIGLAAPQVYEPVRLAMIEFDPENPRYKDLKLQTHQCLLVIINPKIHVLDTELQGFWEGCLSVPELRGLVYRPRKIRIDYFDRSGKAASLTLEGFLATVFQHELDHLDGVLYIDRVKNEPGQTPMAFTQEYDRFDLSKKHENENNTDVDFEE